MSIRMKFLIQTGIIFLFILIGSFLVVPKIKQISNSWNSYVQNVVSRSEYVSLIKSEAGYGGAIHNFKNLVLRGNKKYADRFNKNYDTIISTVNKYKSLKGVTSEEIQSLDIFVSTITKYKNMVPIILDKYSQVKSVKELDKMVKINDGPAVKALGKLLEIYTSLLKTQTANINKNISTAMVFIFVVSIAILLLIIISNVFLSRVIALRIKDMNLVIDEISKGNFTVRKYSKNKDELGILQNKFIEVIEEVDKKLTHTINQLSMSGDAIIPLLTHISEIKQAVNTATEVSHQVATAGQEMSATISEISSNTNDSVEMTHVAVNTAQEGGEIISKASEFSDLASKKMVELSTKVANLKDEAEKIGNVVNVINDLSDQTNLLALNAAIEAARAGEAGRGFAVVADEVRKLAERTQSATNEISNVISGIQNDIESTAKESSNAADLVDKQNKLTDDANIGFSNILENIQEVNSLISGISAAIEEQSATTSEIANSIDNLSEESQTLDNLTVDLMKASDSLINSISSIEQELGKFETSNLATFFIRGKIGHAILLKNVQHCVITNDCNFELPDHNNCLFGQMYYSTEVQNKFAKYSAFSAIDAPHKQVHEFASQVVEAVKTGDFNIINEKLIKLEKSIENFMSSVNNLISQLTS